MVPRGLLRFVDSGPEPLVRARPPPHARPWTWPSMSNGDFFLHGWIIIVRRIAGIADAVALIEPFAQVDQAAALAAEGAPARRRAPDHMFSAMGAGDRLRHGGQNTQQVSRNRTPSVWGVARPGDSALMKRMLKRFL